MKKLLSLLLVMALSLALTPVLASDFVGYEEKDVKKDFSDLPTLNARFIYHPLIGTMEQKGVDYQYNRLTNAHREGSGINIQLTHALVDGTEETNKQAMILASGDVPDLMFVPSLSTYMEWASQGLYMPVDEYLKDMPNYMALVPQEARDACTIDGKLYCFPGSHEETEMKGGSGIVVRYDLYKELGLEKEPQTAQEYYESEGGKAKNFLMFSPASYDDVEIIIDHLKNHEAVIINLRDIKSVIAQRILDFLSGAIYSLDGSIQPIENGLFLLTPGGVGILQKKE